MKKIANFLFIFFVGVAVGYYLHTPQGMELTQNVTNVVPTHILGVNTTQPASPSAGLVRVARVIDGDTIELETGQKVRYIGIDTPETKHPTKGVQCYGKEAAAKNRELVEGKQVRLEKDISETDRYGRLLRFVYLPATSKEIFINEYLVREGYAHAVTFPPDVSKADLFQDAQQIARGGNKGLWSTCINK